MLPATRREGSVYSIVSMVFSLNIICHLVIVSTRTLTLQIFFRTTNPDFI